MSASSRAGQHDGNNCRVRLNQVLAIIVRKEGCQGDPGDFWMYENGYLLFQGLLSSNSVCWWNNALNGATRSLIYYGYVNPGALLVGAEPCALEVVRNAWARRVLQPPPGYQIVALEDIDHCNATAIPQTQWTPLPEAVCAVVLRLSSQARPAGIGTIREALILAFPHVSPPSEQTLYDTLVQLTKERKLYNTSNGYYIVTPERKRSRSHSRTRTRREQENTIDFPSSNGKTMLLSTEEAMAMVHGDMSTVRDGNVTHQCIQTNLADVICGGNASDKILYPRTKRRSSSFPSQRSPDRRGSFRLWSSNRRLRRSASTRTIHKHYADTSSSTEYPNSGESTPTPKKESLLSRIFRRSKRSQCQIGTFSAQFPPTEWFNSRAVHLHSVGTQTSGEKDSGIDISAFLDTCQITPPRSATLPRHHHLQRRLPTSEVIVPTSLTVSREHSPLSYTTLPRKLRGRDRRKQENDQKTSTKPPSSIDNSGPSSIESHKSGSRTGSSLTSGPSSLESHKTVIQKDNNNATSQSKTKISLEVTANQNGVTIDNNTGNTKIFVQNSPVRSVITFENAAINKEQPPPANLVVVNVEEPPLKKTSNEAEAGMNNSRKLSLQLPSKDSTLNFHNLIKNVSNNNNNQYISSSNPDSPVANTFRDFPNSTKSYEGIPLGKLLNNKILEKNCIGSEPNICYKEVPAVASSLSDLSFNFTSLAAQKILKGASINSVDTLVELNMAAANGTLPSGGTMEKQNNCEMVHTDFGLF